MTCTGCTISCENTWLLNKIDKNKNVFRGNASFTRPGCALFVSNTSSFYFQTSMSALTTTVAAPISASTSLDRSPARVTSARHSRPISAPVRVSTSAQRTTAGASTLARTRTQATSAPAGPATSSVTTCSHVAILTSAKTLGEGGATTSVRTLLVDTGVRAMMATVWRRTREAAKI